MFAALKSWCEGTGVNVNAGEKKEKKKKKIRRGSRNCPRKWRHGLSAQRQCRGHEKEEREIGEKTKKN